MLMRSALHIYSFYNLYVQVQANAFNEAQNARRARAEGQGQGGNGSPVGQNGATPPAQPSNQTSTLNLWWSFRSEILNVFTKIGSTVILIFFSLVGIENVVSQLYLEDAIDVVFIIVLLELYYSVVVRSEIGKKWFPRFVYLILYFTFYHLSYHSYTGSKMLIYTTHLMVDFIMIFFFHHFELPLIDSLVPLSLPSGRDTARRRSRRRAERRARRNTDGDAVTMRR